MGDLQLAIDAIRGKLPETELYCGYYEGRHKLSFASDRYQTHFGETLKRLRDNLCPIVVDAPADRMEVLNFSGDDPKKTSAIADAAWEVWQRETLELVSYDVHKAALKCGEGFLIVWPDENGEAKFYPQDPRKCAVLEDEDTGRKLFGAKQWIITTEDNKKRCRINIYYADRIDKFISTRNIEGAMELKDSSFEAYTDTDDLSPTENPYGVIPMFKFSTDAVLSDAIPLQDALNKTLADRLVTQEFGAFRQRWATGLAPTQEEWQGVVKPPFNIGQDRLWYTEEPTVKFGEFSSTDLEPYLKAADSDRLEMARVTGTPLHFFSINTSDAISGKALKALESRFTKKVTRLCLNFGTVWANVMRFALQIEGNGSEGDQLSTQWRSPETQDEKELLEVSLMKVELGIPEEVIWEELDYTKEDIAKFKRLTPDEPVVDPNVILNQRMVANGG
jgi:hypothetical protein